MALFGLVNPTMSIILTVSDSIDTLVSGPECPKCREEVESLFEHRWKCPAGHYYWRCVVVERSNHFYCPPHPTNCLRCYGSGCLYCYHPTKGYRCLKCAEYGAHHCPANAQNDGADNDDDDRSSDYYDRTPSCDNCTDGDPNCPNASIHSVDGL